LASLLDTRVKPAHDALPAYADLKIGDVVVACADELEHFPITSHHILRRRDSFGIRLG
jgi:hypothetical protein